MVVLIVGFLAVPSAWACSCADDGPDVLPAQGAVGVPLGATPIARYPYGTVAELTLSDASGVAVPGTTVVVASGEAEVALVFEPDEVLAPWTTYTAEDGTSAWSFTTGDALDAAAPDTPAFLSLTSSADRPHEVECGVVQDNTCSPWALVTLELDGGEEETVYVVAVEAEGVAAEVLALDASVTVGSGACVANAPLLDQEAVRVRVAARDLSGNTSGWSDWQEVALDWPEDAACPVDERGCSSGAAAAPWWLFPLLVGRRRRVG